MPRSRILVIDDEPGMLRAVARILGADHDVATASSPEDGLAMLASFNPNLVICDLSMPRIDGFEVMRRAKAAHPRVDFILMTGMSDPDTLLVRAIREQAFYFIEKPFNREVLRTLVDRCIELRRLRDAERQHLGRIEHELAEARALQQTMLPAQRANVNGISIAARCTACSELGGDMYDYAPAGNGAVALLIADVSGHGVSAALLTTLVKSAFWSSVGEGFEPIAVIRRAVEGIKAFHDRRFITIACARLDRASRKLQYVSAGHPSSVVWGPEVELKLLDSTGPIVSPVLQDATWDEIEITLPPQGHILLYTDGVVEAAGDGGPFGKQGLTDQIKHHSSAGEPLLEAILDSVSTHASGRPLADDLTLLSASLDG